MKIAEFQSAAPARLITFGIELQDGRIAEKVCTFTVPDEFANRRVRIEIHSVESSEEATKGGDQWSSGSSRNL